MVGDPAQRIGGGSGLRIKGGDPLFQVVADVHQRSSLDGFHDDDRDGECGGKLVAGAPGLLLDVEEVVLDLAEVPRPVAQDEFKLLVDLVEGEAEVDDSPRPLLLYEVVEHSQVHHLEEGGLVEGVEQVEVEVLHTDTVCLIGEDSLGVVETLDLPAGELGGDLEGRAVIPLEKRAEVRLTLSPVVGVGGVVVGDPALIGEAKHRIASFAVDRPLCRLGQTHRPEAEEGGGDLPTCCLSLFHHREFVPYLRVR